MASADTGMLVNKPELIGFQVAPPSVVLNNPPPELPRAAYAVLELRGSTAIAPIDPPSGPRLVHTLICAGRDSIVIAATARIIKINFTTGLLPNIWWVSS